ncbi:MAG: AmmeMemoRadiSam system protein B [Anaerolineales bacterium]|jgi:AmmeMemoRadiSam system protein B
MIDVRPSPIAGAWYPGSAEALKASVDDQLQAAQPPTIAGQIVALIAPHAGHRYSGQVAGAAFRHLEDMHPEVVAVVSPMHHFHAARVLSTGHDAYGTPLGEVQVDHDLIEQIQAHLRKEGLELERVRNDQEHSLEIELPFLQRMLHKPFRLLPLMLRDQSRPVAFAVGKALAAVLSGETAIMIASTDLSHFYSDAIARKLDEQMLARIESFDPDSVLQAEKQEAGFACGVGAIAAVMWAAKDLGADQVRVLCYANSGDVTGDHGSVVGYGAAAIYRSTPS